MLGENSSDLESMREDLITRLGMGVDLTSDVNGADDYLNMSLESGVDRRFEYGLGIVEPGQWIPLGSAGGQPPQDLMNLMIRMRKKGHIYTVVYTNEDLSRIRDEVGLLSGIHFDRPLQKKDLKSDVDSIAEIWAKRQEAYESAAQPHS
jgi:hypothetical protein